jgi:tyrosine-protein kinase Etk/Wzc
MSNHLPAGPQYPSSDEPLQLAAPNDYALRGFEGGSLDAAPSFNWRRYLAAITRYKWLVLGVVLAGAAIGAALTRLIPPKYTAVSTVWIESESGDRSGPIRSKELLQSYAWVELMRSFAVLDPVVRDQRLFLASKETADSTLFSSFATTDRATPGTYRLVVGADGKAYTLETGAGAVVERGRVGEVVGGQVGLQWAPPAAALTPGRTIEFKVASPRDAARALGSQLQIVIDQNANFLRVSLTGPDARRVTETVNSVAGQYVNVAAELKRAKLEEQTSILAEQLERAETNLRDAEMSLEGFRVETITKPSDRAVPMAAGLQVTRDPVFSNFFEMRLERDQLQRDRDAIQRVLQQAQRGGLPVAGLEVIPAVQQSSELRQALTELTAKRAEMRVLQSRYTDQHAQVARLDEEIRTLELQTVPRMAAALISQLGVRIGEISGRIASVSAEMSEIPTRSIEEARRERQVGSAENLYNVLRQRFEESRLAAASSIPDVRVLDRAIVPGKPVNAEDKLRIFLLALAASLGLGLVGAIVMDRLDPRLRYPEQVTQGMGLNILGAVPHVPGPARRLGTDSTAQVIEAFREIRLNVAHAYGSAGPVILTITSPGIGDGKSFVASNLALAFADQGHRTLLIDGDIRRGGLHRLFERARRPGLTDFLSGKATRERIIQTTPFPLLDLISGGTRMRGGPELLGSPAMAQLLVEMRSHYSVILVDSAPLGAGVAPFALGTLTGNLMLVLRSGNTNRELAGAKLDLIDRLPIRVLGAVLNDVPTQGVYRYYPYLSGYEAQDEAALAAETDGPRQLQGV